MLCPLQPLIRAPECRALGLGLGLVLGRAPGWWGATPEPEQALTAAPSWGGPFRPGGTTELRVQLQSETGGDAHVSARSGAFSWSTAVTLAAASPQTLTLPLRPAPDGQVTLFAELPDGRQTRVDLRLRPTPRALAVGVSTLPASSVPGSVRVEPDDLPRSAEGYGPVRILTLGTRDLATLDPAQTQALGQYLAECRPLRLVGAADWELARIRTASGCGGRALGAQAADTVGQTTDAPPDTRPTVAPGGSKALMDGLGGDQGQAALILLPYGILLGALLLRRRPGAWTLAVPGVVAGLIWLALPGSSARSRP